MQTIGKASQTTREFSNEITFQNNRIPKLHVTKRPETRFPLPVPNLLGPVTNMCSSRCRLIRVWYAAELYPKPSTQYILARLRSGRRTVLFVLLVSLVHAYRGSVCNLLQPHHFNILGFQEVLHWHHDKEGSQACVNVWNRNTLSLKPSKILGGGGFSQGQVVLVSWALTNNQFY